MRPWWIGSPVLDPIHQAKESFLVLLEIAVDSVTGLDNAVRGGAQRIELCAALDIGGLTPTAGLMAVASQTPLPVYAMIRPRAGRFVFDDREEAVMLADIQAVRQVGLAGVVLGANLADGRLDALLLARLVAASEGLGVTLHRAFDLTPDLDRALEQAVELGFERILSSGGHPKAMEGAETLKRLVDKAGNRLIVMPGSGIRAGNVREIVAQTGAREVHASGREPLTVSPDPKSLAFGFQTASAMETAESAVRALRDALI
jgi:copper homeostasis protein